MNGRIGLVVAGAGARGAYEAGALSRLMPRMVKDGRPPTVLVGTSAGALNVVGLAGFCGQGLTLSKAADKLVELWSSVHLDEIADVPASLVEDGLRFTGQFLGAPTELPSLLDTRRQRETLSRLLPLNGLRDAIDAGPIDAVAVATTAADTGGTVVFVDRSRRFPFRPTTNAATSRTSRRTCRSTTCSPRQRCPSPSGRSRSPNRRPAPGGTSTAAFASTCR